MKFVRQDYEDARRKRNRAIALLAAVAIVVVLFAAQLSRKSVEKDKVNQPATVQDQTGTAAVSDTTKSVTGVPKDLPSLISKTKRSVVMIKTFDQENKEVGVGSGFFIGEKKNLVSNRHVFRGAHRAEVHSAHGKFSVTNVLGQTGKYDLVRLEVNARRKQRITPLKINNSFPRVGENVVVIGNPMGLEATVSNGIVSAIRNQEPFGKVIQITCPISPGSSGSPVMNMNGEVIGVATYQFLEGQNLNFAIPISRLESLVPVENGDMAGISYQASQVLDGMDNPFDQGALLYFRKEYTGAIPFLEKAVKNDPLNADAWFYLGVCYRETGGTRAVNAFKKAIQLSPAYIDAHIQLGIAYNQMNMQVEAIDILRKALQLESKNDRVLYNLGIAYQLNKSYHSAISVLNRAVDIYPNAKTYFQLGVSYAMNVQHGRAIQAYRQAIEMDPENIQIFLALASSYGAVENWSRGVKLLNEAVVLSPGNPEVHYLLGLMHLGNEDLDSAQLELQLLRNLKSKNTFKYRGDLSRAINNYKYKKRRRR